MRTDGLRVGIFDSGVGGLNVLRACLSLAPDATYFYYGDNLRAPYGERGAEEIVRFVREGLRALGACGVDVAVLACNTASAVCLDRMRSEFPFPVVGMEPAVKSAAGECSDVLVLATRRTAESERLRRLIARFPACRFTVCPADGLAGAIEGSLGRGEGFDVARFLPDGRFDGVVLGCTHYVWVAPRIAAHYGCKVYDGIMGTAKRAVSMKKAGTDDHSDALQKTNNCLSQNADNSREKGVIFLGSGKKINEFVYNSNICFT